MKAFPWTSKQLSRKKLSRRRIIYELIFHTKLFTQNSSDKFECSRVLKLLKFKKLKDINHIPLKLESLSFFFVVVLCEKSTEKKPLEILEPYKMVKQNCIQFVSLLVRSMKMINVNQKTIFTSMCILWKI